MVNTDRETDRVNKNKGDQLADSKVSRDNISESEYKMYMLKLIKTEMVKGFEMMNKHFDEIHTELDETKKMMDKHFDNMNKRFDERDKMLDEWSRELKTDRYKESTEVELKQVSDNDNELINNSDQIVGDGDYNSEVSGSNTSNYNEMCIRDRFRIGI